MDALGLLQSHSRPYFPPSSTLQHFMRQKGPCVPDFFRKVWRRRENHLNSPQIHLVFMYKKHFRHLVPLFLVLFFFCTSKVERFIITGLIHWPTDVDTLFLQNRKHFPSMARTKMYWAMSQSPEYRNSVSERSLR